ncbi:hypothetical protein [Bradyrhizobium sp. Gha]|uniref:BP74-related protein n=1 Tax=Bradyrhizobium sp. Gha TaxID=1855318 RepID=UPI0008E27BCD|nr:hypothetical protein [Bradyrhizobium sp. Gha]SFI60567.1 hypothetical protein SAMN05216525_11122 [Bradyrhizobium sp. Gha]
MRHRISIGCLLLWFAAAWPTADAQQAPEVARFSFRQMSPKQELKHFVFEVHGKASIDEFRATLADPANRKRHVSGVIDQHRVSYNPSWSFHLVPESARLFEMQIEVCDANVTYVEEHLDEVGGSFLPKSFWCPWSSELESEIPVR